MFSLNTLWRLLRIKLGVIVLLALMLAVLLSVARLMMWSLPSHKERIEGWLSDAQYSVTIDTLQGALHGFRPSIDAREVTFSSDSGDPVFQLGHLELELDLLQTLLQGRVIFGFIHLDQLELELLRSPGRGWHVRGASGGEGQPSVELDRIVRRLMRHEQIRLSNASIRLQLQDGPSVPPRQVSAQLQRRGEQLSFKVQVERPERPPLDFRLLGHGLPGSNDFYGRFYLDAPDLGMDQWQYLLPQDYRQLQRFDLSTRLWGVIEGKRPVSIQGQLRVPELLWTDSRGSQHLSGFSTRLKLAAKEQTWRWQLDRIQGSLGEIPLPFKTLHGRWEPGQSLLLSTDGLQLQPLNQALQQSPLVPEAVKQPLSVLAPEGILANVLTRVDLSPDAEQRFELQADLSRVGVSAWKGAPELRGVNGLLRVTEQGGQVDFDARQLLLNFPELYRQGWSFDHARGQVSWGLEETGVWVKSGLLEVAMPGIDAHGRFSLEAPYDKQTASEFTLMIGMDHSDGSMTPLFVPDQVVDEALFSWLETAIEAGKLNYGGFLYHGALESWAAEPSIQMYFDVSDGLIRYQPEWPPVEEAEALTLIKNDEVLVDIGGGRIYQTRVDGGRVYLPSANQRLQVQADLSGSALDSRRVLLESPLREQLGDEFEKWHLEGKVATRLDLAIDLDNAEDSKIRVTADVSQGRFYAPELSLEFRQLQGRIQYREDRGLSSDRLEGRFFDRPVQARIHTEQRSDGVHTLVEADGSVAIDTLNEWLQQPLLNFWQGETAYHAQLDICAATPQCTTLEIQSELKGLRSQDIPAPFGKTEQTRRPLLVRTNLGGERQWLRVQYGRQLHTLLRLDQQGLAGGEIVLGDNQPPPQAIPDGLRIRGHLAELQPQAWQVFSQRLFPEPLDSSGRLAIDPVLEAVALGIDRLQWGDQAIEALQLEVAAKSGGWQVRLDAPRIKGTVLLPGDADTPYRIDLARLYLPDDQADASEPESDVAEVDPLGDFEPAELPAMEVSVADFRLGDQPYGQWHLQLQPQPDGVHITGIKGRIRAIDGLLDIRWLRAADGHRTDVKLDLKSEQLSKVQQAWEMEPLMEAKDARLKGQVSWQGSPLNFNWQTLDGELGLSTGSGRFMEAGSSSGAIKLFGILNFKALGRRLRLDFSDLSKKGLSFDSITGRYRINQGLASSLQPLQLSGPSADIEMKGDLDLVKRTLDQTMRVNLPLTENLPLTAILLGTPQVAGAMFLIEKLAGKQIQKFTSVRYRVTGSWQDPQIEPIKAPPPPAKNESIWPGEN